MMLQAGANSAWEVSNAWRGVEALLATMITCAPDAGIIQDVWKTTPRIGAAPGTTPQP